MDRSNVEPGYGLHTDLAGLCKLLRKDLRERFRGVPGHPYEMGFDLALRPARVQQPLGHGRSHN